MNNEETITELKTAFDLIEHLKLWPAGWKRDAEAKWLSQMNGFNEDEVWDAMAAIKAEEKQGR